MAAAPPTEQERALGALRIRNALRSLDPECERCGDKGDVIQDDDQGCFTCRACGDVVQGIVIASDVEWRTFSDHSGPDPNRVGDIGSAGQEGDAELTMLGAGSHMISKQTQALFFKREKSTSAAKAFCEALSARLAGTQYIREDCMRLFQRVDAAGKLKRRPLEAVVAACMLASLKIHKSARTINAIVPLTSVTARDIQKCWLEVVNHAKVEFKSERDAAAADRVGVDGAIRNADGAQFLPRFCALLRLPMPVETAAASMCRKIKDLVEGKSPTTICATALYLASRLHATEKRHIDEIASTVSIAADTIKRCFREVYAMRADIVPAGYATAFAIESLACM